MTNDQPSEMAPASAALLAQLIPRYLDPEAYGVVLGGAKHAEALLERQWGHGQFRVLRRCMCLYGCWVNKSSRRKVVFTGSGRVGKIVAGAAAKTLTPTTLEVSENTRACTRARTDAVLAGAVGRWEQS